MNKIKAAVLILATIFVANVVTAQSIEDGKKFFYYEKYKSAQDVFEKLVAANPNNTDAVYWLALTLITPDEFKDLPRAKELLRKTLETNSNNPLLLVGMGHIELHEGKVQDARQRFETALSLSQSKSIPVLNAIGIANGNYDSKNGDAAYAIEKLKLATTLKGFKDPETYCLLGDAYRKFIDGGSAIQAYQNALAINPKYVRALYRIGKVYQTQGITQVDIYMKYYNDAIAADANYIPVYQNLYLLYYQTDVVKSAEYLEKYLTLMGSDEPQACYYRTTIKYAQGLFNEAIAQAESCIAAGGATPDPRLYGIIGYAKDKLNDSLGAKNAFEKFFQLQKPEKIGPTDYSTYARILLKFPGNEALAGTYIDKAVASDSTEAGKVNLLRSVASGFESQKKFADAADWYKKILNVKKNPTKTDIFNTANNYSRGGNYQAAIDNWNVYTTKYPNETYGYYMTGVTQGKIDTVMAMGLAVPSYQKVIDLGEAQWATDSVKVKTHLLNAYKYFIQYSYNVLKDKKAASDYCTKYLVKEPNDEEVKGFQKMFDAPTRNTPGARPATTPATKPATGGGTAPKPAGTGTKTPATKKK
jgi:tetratricopeptide (TPR) repeat protein